jgi:hypothetical protein
MVRVLPGKFANEGQHVWVGPQMPAMKRTADGMPCFGPAAPQQPNVGRPRGRIRCDTNLNDRQAQQALAVHRCRGLGVPQRRKIGREAADLFGFLLGTGDSSVR